MTSASVQRESKRSEEPAGSDSHTESETSKAATVCQKQTISAK